MPERKSCVMNMALSHKRIFHTVIQQRVVGVDLAEGVAQHFTLPVGAQLFHIEICVEQTFRFLVGEKKGVVDAFPVFIPADRGEGAGMTRVFSVRIRHGDAAHILIGSRGKRLHARFHAFAVVGDENDQTSFGIIMTQGCFSSFLGKKNSLVFCLLSFHRRLVV